MSKTRARERAKARKGKKRIANPVLAAQKFSSGRFNPESNSIKSPRITNVRNLSVTKRGANRSS